MQTAQQGDRVQVHYVKRFPDGSVASSRSRGRAPLELTIGIDHPRLPGVGPGLIGLAPGSHLTLTVPAEATSRPGRIRHLDPARFAAYQSLPVGKWVRILDRQGRRRPVRILEVRDRVVLVDTSAPRAGQAIELDVELVAIHAPEADGGLRGAAPEKAPEDCAGRRCSPPPPA